jgi:hypothetical protein
MHTVFIWKTEEKRLLGRPRCRYASIKRDVREIRFDDVVWIHQDRDQWQSLVNMVMNIEVA